VSSDGLYTEFQGLVRSTVTVAARDRSVAGSCGHLTAPAPPTKQGPIGNVMEASPKQLNLAGRRESTGT
jgi:hypothetical protein